jgi:DNA polymerase-4
MGRWVLHLDLDAFFASVEQLTRPTLAGRAVLVGGTGPRGVVAGASYEARVHGAHSAMPMSRARRLVPGAVVLPPRLAVYRVLSERVFAIVRELDGVIEQIALDEAFVEPAPLAGAPPERVEEVAEQLRANIREATGLTGSVGAGSGKQLAKIASTLAKPDGVHVVPHGTERELLAPLPVRKLWGVGPVAEATLRRVGVETIGALAALQPAEVTDLLGTAVGTELHKLALGVDRRPVAERGEAKQISAETTFDADLSDLDSVHRAVAEMTAHAHRRLVAAGRGARTVTVKIRGADFTTRSRSETAATAGTDLAALTRTAQRIAEGALPPSGVRLIGVSLSGLTDFVQEQLFGDQDDLTTRSVPTAAIGTDPAESTERATGSDPTARSDPAVTDAGSAGADAVEAIAVPSGVIGDRGGSDPHIAVGSPRTAITTRERPPPPVESSPGGQPERGGQPDLGGQPGRGGESSPGGQPDRGWRAGHGWRLADDVPGWRAGDDVRHAEHGHGWVQGCGHGRVTVRFETRSTGPGPARTMAAADPLASLE